MTNTGRHRATLKESRQESTGDIPARREVFYDWDNVYIDDESGLEYPASIVGYNYHDGMHSIENKANVTLYWNEVGCKSYVVEAEICEADRLHFVRIEHPSLARTYVWDKDH